MAQEREIIAFDVVERGDVGVGVVERLAQEVWRSMSADQEGACDHPRWITSGPVPDVEGYTSHRFEGTVHADK
ncbi:hypothetical protein [Rhodococcus sp. AG1013]|uniref:hypothetical protein n=1 Tax=unclassified Rhodococcus (in: high G+C Gram-positive bacteria) TaxID=192944 RepID=UPI000E09E74C|nr:hypothetical protein [Rhodococcus sp. AG1013]RDI34079.1 hypothetical protein DEU38_102438 [Rhodococcus sp. AG1013]